MKAVGIICEFNPFHKGHAYLLDQVKKNFPDQAVLCLMSGNFVQRGAFAIQAKYSRACTAIRAGADLVLELPFPFSSLSAEAFAGSGVSILSRLGVCDTLAFGSEIADLSALYRCAQRLRSQPFCLALDEYLKEHKGKGFPAAREQVYRQMFGDEPILSCSNASLAVEYIMAMLRQGVEMTPFSVLRKGQGIRSEKSDAEFASATGIRRCILADEDYQKLIPDFSYEEMAREKEAGRFPVEIEALSRVIFYLLKTRTPRELSQIYGFAALSHRAKHCAGECHSLEELVQNMKNPGVTDSRIRRALVALLCGIPRHAEKEFPAFTQVLAANEKGRELLGQIKEKGSIPVFTKPVHALRSSDPQLLRQASFAHLADEIYAMAFPSPVGEGYFLKQFPAIL